MLHKRHCAIVFALCVLSLLPAVLNITAYACCGCPESENVLVCHVSAAVPEAEIAAADMHDYSEKEESIIAGMIKAFLGSKDADLSLYISALRVENARLADVYTDIMAYWKNARTSLTVNRYNPATTLYQDESGQQISDSSAMGKTVSCFTRVVNGDIDEIPKQVSKDNSRLCIVCLGYALQNSGAMKNELYGRLLTAYAVWKQYPGAYIAVTGGGTARDNRSVTEGGQMKKFLVEVMDVPEQYVICEDKAANTAGNAINTLNILDADYPQVDSLFMVTSDYHIARGSTFFNTAAQLHKYKTGKEYAIVGNCGFATKTAYENESVSYAGLYRQMYTICDVNEGAADSMPQYIALSDPVVEGSSVSVAVRMLVKKSATLDFLVAYYDSDGRMLAVTAETRTVDGSTASFTAECPTGVPEEDIARRQIMAVTENGFCPLGESVSLQK